MTGESDLHTGISVERMSERKELEEKRDDVLFTDKLVLDLSIPAHNDVRRHLEVLVACGAP